MSNIPDFKTVFPDVIPKPSAGNEDFIASMTYLKRAQDIGFELLLSLLMNIVFCAGFAMISFKDFQSSPFIKWFASGAFTVMALVATVRLATLLARGK